MDLLAGEGALACYPGPALVVSGDGRVLATNAAGEAVAARLRSGEAVGLSALVARTLTGETDDAETMAVCEADETGLEFMVLRLGKGPAALVLGRDATLERNFQVALVDSRRRYKELVETSSDFAWETGRDGSFVFVSPRGALGWRADELVGRQPRDFVIDQAGDDAPLPFATEERLDNVEIWFRRADRAAACLSVSCLPIFGEGRRWLGARGVCRDVTEAREQEARLARARHREELLTYIVRAIRDEIEPQKMLDAAASATGRGLDARGCRIYRNLHDAGLTTVAMFGAAPESAAAAGLLARLSVAGGLIETESESSRLLAIATTYRQAVNGAICLWRRGDESAWDANDRVLLGEIGDHLGIALEQIAKQEILEVLSARDTLTGLLNRRTFFDEVQRRLLHAARTGRSGALCYVNLDNFKLVNDLHGHQHGDAALRAVASLLIDSSRAHDLVGRLGGDEFALWLEETEETGAGVKAEALLESTRELRSFSGDPARPLGLSVGIAVHRPESGETLRELMERADGVMYAVKRAGKGGYETAAPVLAAPLAEAAG